VFTFVEGSTRVVEHVQRAQVSLTVVAQRAGGEKARLSHGGALPLNAKPRVGLCVRNNDDGVRPGSRFETRNKQVGGKHIGQRTVGCLQTLPLRAG
jgi:hypothetical protein